MQYKKKEITEKILEAGKNEYAEKGFRAGNISAIAAAAGVPVGNLYRYFDGKNGLLDAIVGKVYKEIPKLVQSLADMDSVREMSLNGFLPILTENLLGIFDKYGKEIIILVDKCATTRYEDFFEKLAGQVDEIVKKKIYPDPRPADDVMSGLISKAFLNSILDMLRMDLDREQTTVIAQKLLMFYFLDIDARK